MEGNRNVPNALYDAFVAIDAPYRLPYPSHPWPYSGKESLAWLIVEVNAELRSREGATLSSTANCSFWCVVSGPRWCASSGKNTDFFPSIATFFFQPPWGLASAGGAVCSFGTGASSKVLVAPTR